MAYLYITIIVLSYVYNRCPIVWVSWPHYCRMLWGTTDKVCKVNLYIILYTILIYTVHTILICTSLLCLYTHAHYIICSGSGTTRVPGRGEGRGPGAHTRLRPQVQVRYCSYAYNPFPYWLLSPPMLYTHSCIMLISIQPIIVILYYYYHACTCVYTDRCSSNGQINMTRYRLSKRSAYKSFWTYF